MLTVLLLALAPAAGAPSGSPACHLIYPVAPDAAAARRIAEAVIAARPYPRRERFVLHVMPDRDDPRQWSASQSLAPPARGQAHVRGGGGIGMGIDRCTGAVSRLFYQR